MTRYHSPSQAAAQLKARRAEQQALRVAALEKATVTEPQPIRVPVFETPDARRLNQSGARYRRRRCKRLVKEVESHAQSTGCLAAIKWLDKHGESDGEDEAGIVALANAECLLARHVTGCPEQAE